MLTEHSVRTLDELTLTTHVPTCYTVAMADCSSQPQFAVFLKKVDSTTSPLVQRRLYLTLFNHFLPGTISLYTHGTTYPLALFNHSPTATIYLHISGTTHPLILMGSFLLCAGTPPLEAGHVHAYCSPVTII